MLQTLPPPMHNDHKPPYDYHSYKPHPSRYSPPESPRTLPPFVNAQDNSMNNPHRGLPPPVGMQFPHPTERPSSSFREPFPNLPAPPSQWAGQDESMRQWLQAKAEEDRRRQEEEKTKQEGLRLDQRKIEQSMLRESLQGGVPPPMVPLIFTGMGSGALPAHALEWAQQYLASFNLQNQQQQQQHQQQLQAQQQQQQQQQQIQQIQQHSPQMQRDARTGIPPNPYGPQQMQGLGQGPAQDRIITAPPPTQALARLNTVDIAPQQSLPSQQPRQTAPQSMEQNSGPGLFFHHWTPPTSNQPPTPSGKSTQGSPYSQTAGSHLRSEYQSTPKKRKHAGSHGPTSQPQDPSPPFSTRSSRERDTSPQSPRSKPNTRPHSRQRSDTSSSNMDARPIARPSSRQQRMEELSGGHSQDLRRTMAGGSEEPHHNHFRHESMKAETR